MKYTAFTRYFTFKGPASAQMLPCVRAKTLWNQVRNLPEPKKCPHLIFCADFSMQNTLKVRNIHWNMTTCLFLPTFHFESVLHDQIYAQSRWEHSTFKMFCIPMPNLGEMQVLWSEISAKRWELQKYFIAWRFSVF